jgi:hypothetical protein
MTARGDLQALIDYTGLSIGEAASVVGVAHDTLSNKLRGRPRYDARPDEIAALTAVADRQDRAVAEALRQIDALAAEHGAAGVVALILYRRDEDLPPEDDPPFASIQRMVAARIARARPDVARLVIFDRGDYEAWLGRRADTRARRAEWAAEQSLRDPGRADQNERIEP